MCLFLPRCGATNLGVFDLCHVDLLKRVSVNVGRFGTMHHPAPMRSFSLAKRNGGPQRKDLGGRDGFPEIYRVFVSATGPINRSRCFSCCESASPPKSITQKGVHIDLLTAGSANAGV